ncbi:Transcriptional activator spt7 [Lobulomyces angularis]|nr:Transcriptional activator spt7 [Lobulomyces angularis]
MFAYSDKEIQEHLANCLEYGVWRSYLTNQEYLTVINNSKPSDLLESKIRIMLFENLEKNFFSPSKNQFQLNSSFDSKNIHNTSVSETDLDPLLIPIDDTYSLLEPLVEAEKTKLEDLFESDNENDNLLITSAPIPSTRLKYLQEYLTKSTGQTVNKFKSVVEELNPNLNKWTPQGQEEFFDLCEKVLSGLKNYKPHSLSFLTKVKKTEVKDYFDIIKRPMDLGLISKNLKNRLYKDKKDFQADLDLIWSNCMTYNQHPENPVRLAGLAMRKRSNELLRMIPDGFKVKDEDSDSDDDTQEKTSRRESSRRDSQDSTFRSPFPEDLVKEDSVEIKLEKDTVMEDVAPEIDEQFDKVEDNEFFLQEVKNNDLTLNFRQKLQKARSQQFSKPFPERKAIQAMPEDFKKFAVGEKEYLKRLDLRRKVLIDKDGNFVNLENSEENQTMITEENNVSNLMNVEESNCEKGKGMKDVTEEVLELNLEEFFLPELFNFSLPTLHGNGEGKFFFGKVELDIEDLFSYETPKKLLDSLPSLSDYPEFLPDRSSKLNYIIMSNLHHLRKVKEYNARISARETNFHESWLGIPAEPEIYKPDYQKFRPERPDLNDNSAGEIFSQNLSVLVSHVGFDAISECAMSTLLDVGTKYIQNLGKTFNLYKEKLNFFINSFNLSSEDILLLVLKQNGLYDLSKLEYYIRADCLLYGQKLKDLAFSMKLSSAYLDNWSPTDDEDLRLEDYSEQVISGSLFEELDIDILGMKDMGLDFLSIPTELWNKKAEKPIKGRLKRKIVEVQNDPILESTVNKLTPPEKWPEIDPSQQIGLLKNLYQKIVSNNELAKEDEFKTLTMAKRNLIKVATQGRKRALQKEEIEQAKKKKRFIIEQQKLLQQQEAKELLLQQQQLQREQLLLQPPNMRGFAPNGSTDSLLFNNPVPAGTSAKDAKALEKELRKAENRKKKEQREEKKKLKLLAKLKNSNQNNDGGTGDGRVLVRSD